MSERSFKPPHQRRATETSFSQKALYATACVVTLAAMLSPTWPKWQAVLLALSTGACIATAVRDAWWRKEMRAWDQSVWRA